MTLSQSEFHGENKTLEVPIHDRLTSERNVETCNHASMKSFEDLCFYHPIALKFITVYIYNCVF